MTGGRATSERPAAPAPSSSQVRLLEPRGLRLLDAQWLDYLALSLAPPPGGARFRRSHVAAALARLSFTTLDPQLWGAWAH